MRDVRAGGCRQGRRGLSGGAGGAGGAGQRELLPRLQAPPRDAAEELVASRRLYSLKLFNGFTGCGVLEYLYLAEVTCIGKALIVGILLCLDIRLQNGVGTFDLFTY